MILRVIDFNPFQLYGSGGMWFSKIFLPDDGEADARLSIYSGSLKLSSSLYESDPSVSA